MHDKKKKDKKYEKSLKNTKNCVRKDYNYFDESILPNFAGGRRGSGL